jgi:hypothetical protein
MNIEMATYLVRNASGAVDPAATLAKFEVDMAKFVADTETETEVIAMAVNEVFDDHKSTLNMPILVSFSLTKLNAQPANYRLLEKKVMDYIRSNADQPAVKDGDKVIREAEAPRTRLFRIAKGIKGGVSRWSDIPEKTETPAA